MHTEIRPEITQKTQNKNEGRLEKSSDDPDREVFEPRLLLRRRRPSRVVASEEGRHEDPERSRVSANGRRKRERERADPPLDAGVGSGTDGEVLRFDDLLPFNRETYVACSFLRISSSFASLLIAESRRTVRSTNIVQPDPLLDLHPPPNRPGKVPPAEGEAVRRVVAEGLVAGRATRGVVARGFGKVGVEFSGHVGAPHEAERKAAIWREKEGGRMRMRLGSEVAKKGQGRRKERTASELLATRAGILTGNAAVKTGTETRGVQRSAQRTAC